MSGLPRLMIEALPDIAAATRTEDRHLERGPLQANLGAVCLSLGLVSIAPALLPISAQARMVVAAALAWILGEVFTRSQRLALPSAVTACLFAEMSAAGFALMIPGTVSAGVAPDFPDLVRHHPGGMAVALALTAGLMVVHHRLVRAPVDLAIAAILGTAAVLLAGAALAPAAMADTAHHIALACAWITLSVAVAFDLSDRERTTRSADVAFWLHCAADALFLYSVIACPGHLKELSILIGFPAFAVVGILFDRMILITMTKALLAILLAAAVSSGDLVIALVTLLPYGALIYATTFRVDLRRRFLERTFWQIAPQLPPIRERI